MKRQNLPFLIIVVLLGISTTTARAIVVGTVGELMDAISDANQGGDRMIECENGIYLLSDFLYVTADSVTVKSLLGDRDSVCIRGPGMGGGVSHVFLVAGSDFCVRDLSLGWVANHGVQIQGEHDADRPQIHNVRFVDTYEQMLKVSAGGVEFSDSGLVEQCLFEYDAGVGPQWYIGGIDCHRCRNWTVRNNTFRHIRSPGGSIAEHAVHFWNDSENTLVECNLIVNCDRGIGFGLGSSQHIGGTIRNNMIYHDTSEGFADVGISLETAPDAQVYNNTIYHEHSYVNAIEYRFPTTLNVLIANNLTNKDIRARDGATGTDTCNVLTADPSWFTDISVPDLHLAYGVPLVVDQGMAIAGLTADFDGDSRPHGPGYDIGADEYLNTGIDDTDLGHKALDDFVYQIQPNPFRNSVNIKFQLSGSAGQADLRIYDTSGRVIFHRSPPTSFKIPASVVWSGTDQTGRPVQSGVYFVRLETSTDVITKSVILLK